MAKLAGDGRRRMAVGVAAAFAGALLWGFSGACAQIALSAYRLDPLFITAVRSAIAALLLLGFSSFRYRAALGDIMRTRRLWPWFVLFGGGLFLSQATFAASVEHTNAGTATVLQSLATVFVMVIVCARAKRFPGKFELGGRVCALASTWLIATQGNPASLALPAEGLGWGIANALAVTLYILVPKRLYERWPSIPVISCGMLAAAVLALAVWACAWSMGAMGGRELPAMDVYGALTLVVGIGVLGTALAFGLYLYGVSVVGAVRGSLIGAAEPASAMILTAVWLGTTVTVPDWLGLILMMATIFLVSVPKRT